MKQKCCVSDSYKYYFTPSAFHAISKSKSQPNHETKQIAQPLVVRFFCDTAERRKLAFVSDDGAQKNGICPSRMPICFWFDDGPRR